jgi:GTP 3',8-cyclase
VYLPPSPPVSALLDRFGRIHSYLRVSVTDRCNFRCVYCLPAEGVTWLPRDSLLGYEEIARLVRVMAGMGLRRVRLTGGEPTIRRDLPALVEALASVPGIEEVSMTTNAHRFAGEAARLKAAGLTRVNISVDSLDAARFSRITRGGELAAVLAGIEAAIEAGLTPVKLNMVVMRGENDDELVAMTRWALARAPAIQLRFIEYMPFDTRVHQNVRAAEMRERLSEAFGDLVPQPARQGGGPARHWQLGPLVVGFIAPITEHFCATCNRLRLLADGHLRTCLAHENTPSLRDVLRSGASDETIAEVVRSIVLGKPAGHLAEADGGTAFEGVMTHIGG